MSYLSFQTREMLNVFSSDIVNSVGRLSGAEIDQMFKDAEQDARIRELLLRAGCAEETERVPLENVIQLEDAREGAESS